MDLGVEELLLAILATLLLGVLVGAYYDFDYVTFFKEFFVSSTPKY